MLMFIIVHWFWFYFDVQLRKLLWSFASVFFFRNIMILLTIFNCLILNIDYNDGVFMTIAPEKAQTLSLKFPINVQDEFL